MFVLVIKTTRKLHLSLTYLVSSRPGLHSEILSYRKESCYSWAWWLTPIIPALGRKVKEGIISLANLGYIVSSRLV